jgi:hypothetical protein
MRDIAEVLGSNFDTIIRDLYLNKKLSGKEISDELLSKTKILITPRSIQRRLKSLGVIRTFSQAFNLAIKRGRKSYEHLKRAVKSKDKRKGINTKLRYQIFLRDGFKCILCGRTAQEEPLQIDHVKPVVYGGTNDTTNLRTLCGECNIGKMLTEERKLPKI